MNRRIISACALVLAASAAWSQTATQEIRRVYLSQGEWRGRALTESGRVIIADAARGAASGPTTQIDINGLADLASTPEGQRRTSRSRVEAVREEFVRDGVAPDDIAVQEIDTADGSIPPLQGEAATKRVVIVFHE
ncbi:MAG TPA: hypothetical protein VJY39_21935 [Acidisphaera sp.]|nr:hypothetical protein [Acidisphaera sp.]